MGGKNRAGSQPWIPITLAAKSVADLLQATNLTRSAWAKYRSFSLHSLIAVVATFAAFSIGRAGSDHRRQKVKALLI